MKLDEDDPFFRDNHFPLHSGSVLLQLLQERCTRDYFAPIPMRKIPQHDLAHRKRILSPCIPSICIPYLLGGSEKWNKK